MAEGQGLSCGGKESGAALVGDVLVEKELRLPQGGPWDRLLL